MRRLWAVIALTVGLALSGCGGAPEPAADIGGPFTLVDTNGRTVTERDLLGRPSAVFFGFTYCPEVCPTTLGELTAAMQALGPDADRLNVVFVSVDPERDTPQGLKLYLSNFDHRIRGFTGTPEAIARITEAYRVYYRKVPVEGGGYTIDHTSTLYLFDRDGAFVEPVSYGESVEAVTDSLRRLTARR
jgi:protein SCO1